jgi:hypothetical protein
MVITMLFSRDFLLENRFFHKELRTVAPDPSTESKPDEADLLASLISQDEYGNRNRQEKLVKIRQLQSELSQYIHYFNSANFLFGLCEALFIIKNIVTEAAVNGTSQTDLMQKINNIEKEYGATFKFKNKTNLIELLREVLDEYASVKELHSSFSISYLFSSWLKNHDDLKKQLSRLLDEYEREKNERLEPHYQPPSFQM